MAIRKIDASAPPAEVERLKQAVVAELRRDDSQPHPPGAPVVLKEENQFPVYSHYYVVWDGFEKYSQEVRYSAVYQAIVEGLGSVEALNTTVAMGLTVEEARNMGFEV